MQEETEGTQHAAAIQAAIDAITRIDDPAHRARAATEALDILHTGNATLSRLRRQDIATLRTAKWSYRKIADALGIHFSRVRQIETGTPTGNSARARTRDPGHNEGTPDQ